MLQPSRGLQHPPRIFLASVTPRRFSARSAPTWPRNIARSGPQDHQRRSDRCMASARRTSTRSGTSWGSSPAVSWASACGASRPATATYPQARPGRQSTGIGHVLDEKYQLGVAGKMKIGVSGCPGRAVKRASRTSTPSPRHAQGLAGVRRRQWRNQSPAGRHSRPADPAVTRSGSRCSARFSTTTPDACQAAGANRPDGQAIGP